MEDLTAQLERDLAVSLHAPPYPNSHDEYDLGDGSSQRVANPLEQYSALGRDGGLPASTCEYPAYGQLVNPPSYEDSIMYESAPNSVQHLAASTSGLLDSAAGPSSGGAAIDIAEAPFSPLVPRRQQEQPLIITVTEPIKREGSGLFGLNGASCCDCGILSGSRCLKSGQMVMDCGHSFFFFVWGHLICYYFTGIKVDMVF